MRKIIVFLTLFLFSFNLVSAETDCPFGLANDPAPGECGLYIDKDRNNYCDHSELESIDVNVANSVVRGEVVDKNLQKKVDQKYKFVLILISVLVLYLISFLSEKAGYLKLLIHRRIWNMILLLSFLVSAIFGIMLIMAINFGWFLSIYAFILYWHVEFGTIMAIVTIFHIAWHWTYFTHMMKKRKI